MTELKVTGQIIQINPTETISDKFKKRTFTLALDAKYPQTIQFTLTQNRCDFGNQVRPGDGVEVYFNLEGREYNGKCYNTLNVWNLKRMSTGGERRIEANTYKESFNTQPQDNDDLPF